jgi:hypothetical protein
LDWIWESNQSARVLFELRGQVQIQIQIQSRRRHPLSEIWTARCRLHGELVPPSAKGGGWDGRAGRRGVVALAAGEVMVLWRRRRGGGGGGGTWLRRRGKSRRECVTASREVPLIQSMNVRLPSQLGVSTAAAWRRGRRDAWRRPAGLAEVAGGSAASPGVHVTSVKL